MGRKLDEVKIVTFKKDYKPGRLVIYKKGETHAIHQSIVQKLTDNKADIEVKDFDEKKEVAEAKKAFDEAKKAEKNNS